MRLRQCNDNNTTRRAQSDPKYNTSIIAASKYWTFTIEKKTHMLISCVRIH